MSPCIRLHIHFPCQSTNLTNLNINARNFRKIFKYPWNFNVSHSKGSVFIKKHEKKWLKIYTVEVKNRLISSEERDEDCKVHLADSNGSVYLLCFSFHCLRFDWYSSNCIMWLHPFFFFWNGQIPLDCRSVIKYYSQKHLRIITLQ